MHNAKIEIADETPDLRCSKCGEKPSHIDFVCICPNCGADMRQNLSREIIIQEIELDVEESSVREKS
jgi:Zn finger protein HypA/HybF involved in hydrogenase expression